MRTKDDILRMYENHPPGSGFADLVGGKIGKEIRKNGYETCASQLSYALNHTGFTINASDVASHRRPDLINPRPSNKSEAGMPRSHPDRDGLLYIFSVLDMRVYLDGQFGTAENIKVNGYGNVAAAKKAEKFADETGGRHGIIAYGHRHVDLWRQFFDGSYASHYYTLFSDASAIKRGIFFWAFTDLPLFD